MVERACVASQLLEMKTDGTALLKNKNPATIRIITKSANTILLGNDIEVNPNDIVILLNRKGNLILVSISIFVENHLREFYYRIGSSFGSKLENFDDVPEEFKRIVSINLEHLMAEAS